jgi:hypothetical protein
MSCVFSSCLSAPCILSDRRNPDDGHNGTIRYSWELDDQRRLLSVWESLRTMGVAYRAVALLRLSMRRWAHAKPQPGGTFDVTTGRTL